MDTEAALPQKIVDPMHDLLLGVLHASTDYLVKYLLHRAKNQIGEHACVPGCDHA
ncbi:MAG: hypothetical protein WBY94_23795 [Polyangiaceae bacterium]